MFYTNGTFELYNNAHIYDDFERFQKAYLRMNKANRASAYKACSICCKGHIPSGYRKTDRMAEIKEYLSIVSENVIVNG
ncbi:hypothetical protein [Mahella australiensis]|uniref:hypothetical protein n=1 Tax=Mahella australiensis TaxID=252966 RepID=UPI0002F224D5|nr:hypothetical protein [Mahella australiensis]